MDDVKDLSRREFTVRSALAILGGVAITVSACSGDDGSPISPSTMRGNGNGPSPETGSASGLVSANHGHTATITEAQLTARGMLSLDIRGGADHAHTVELTTAQVQQIADGARVSMDSSVDRVHRHTVTFN